MAEIIPLFPLGTVLFPGVVLPLHVFEPRYRELVRDLLALDTDLPREFGVVAIRQGWEVGERAVTALHEVGCTAELRQVVPYRDGRFDIAAVGGRRFRLLGVIGTAGVDESLVALPAAAAALAAATEPRSYLQGVVEELADDSTGLRPPAAESAPAQPGGQTDALSAAEEADILAAAVRDVFVRCRTLLHATQTIGEAAPDPDPDGPVELPALPLPADPTMLSFLVGSAAPLTLDDQQTLLAIDDTVGRLRRELRLLKREATMLSRLRAVPVPLAELRVPTSPN